jgi:hypothetical protein
MEKHLCIYKKNRSLAFSQKNMSLFEIYRHPLETYIIEHQHLITIIPKKIKIKSLKKRKKILKKTTTPKRIVQ